MIAFLRDLRDEIESWCKGRSWIVRLPLLLWFAWMLWRMARTNDQPR